MRERKRKKKVRKKTETERVRERAGSGMLSPSTLQRGGGLRKNAMAWITQRERERERATVESDMRGLNPTASYGWKGKMRRDVERRRERLHEKIARTRRNEPSHP